MSKSITGVLLHLCALWLLCSHVVAQANITSLPTPIAGDVAELEITMDPVIMEAYITYDSTDDFLPYTTVSMYMKHAGTETHQVTACEVYLEDNSAIAPNSTCLYSNIPYVFDANDTNPVYGEIAVSPIYPVGLHNFNWHIETTINSEQTEFIVPIEFTIYPAIENTLGITGYTDYAYDDTTDTYTLKMVENSTITITFVLVSQPGQDTTFTFDTDSPHDYIVSAPVEILTTATYAEWSATKTVTLEIPSDGLTTGNYTINLETVITGDAYTFPTVIVDVVDIDTTAWIVSATEFNVTEGESTTFTINADSKPTDDMTLTFPQHTLYTIEPAVVTITSSNFDVPQTVTITANQNNVILGTVTFQVPLFTLVTSDAFYPLLTIPTLDLSLLDDDLNILSMSPVVGNDDGVYNTTMQFDDDVTLDVRELSSSSAMVSGFSLMNTNTAADDLTVVDGNFIDATSPYYSSLNSSLVTDFPSVPMSNVFVRTFYCRFGDGDTYLITPAYIQGPRTLYCYVPACVENPLDVTTKCITPINVYLLVTNQDSTSKSFTYMWGPEHDEIDPLINDPTDEVWRARVTEISPVVIDMREETWVTVYGYHLAVVTTRDNDAASIPGAEPKCRFDGYLTRSAEFIDDTDHSQGFRCLAPTRLDLTGDSVIEDVTFEVSIDGGTEFFTPYDITIGYYDYRREKDSNAWTYFFIAVNIAFLLFFLFLLKDVICANLCKRCIRADDAEDEDDIDIRGPKPVSDYLKGKIEHLLTRDIRALDAYRAQQAEDREQREQLQALGFLNLDDTDVDANREREEERKRAEKIKSDVQRARLRRAGANTGKAAESSNGVEMTDMRGRGSGVVLVADDKGSQPFSSPFSV